MNNYKELKVWHKSMDLVEKVYKLTSLFLKEEKYGLTSQIQISTQLLLAVRIGYSNQKHLEPIFNLLEEIQKMTFALIKKF